MAGLSTQATRRAEAERIRELLDYLDSQVGRPGVGSCERRAAERRQFRSRCMIRYLAGDEETVCAATGRTRDISETGVGVLTKLCVAIGTPLHITVALAEGKSVSLTGRVAFSRLVRIGWYLLGTRFESFAEGSPLSRKSLQGSGSGGQSARQSPSRPGADQGETEAGESSRDVALRTLASAGRYGITASETREKVLTLSRAGDHAVREAAIPALMQISGHEGRDALVRMLQDPSATIQGEAASALGKLDAHEAVDQLKELLTHQDIGVALRAASALGRMGDRSGLPLVSRYVMRDGAETSLATVTLGVIVGQRFRGNTDGTTAARKYLKKLKT